MYAFQGMIRLDFVIDAACVVLDDPIKGHVPVGFIVIDKSKLSKNVNLRTVPTNTKVFLCGL